MKQAFSLRSAVALALVSFTVPSALAAGFQVNEHSANGLGRAMAGQAAMPENASVLASNPAAITAFDDIQFSGQLSYISPDVDIRGDMTAAIGDTVIPVDASADGVAESAIVPAFFMTMPVSEKLSVGIGSFTNYGLATNYGDTYNALHYADDAEVMSVTVNPAVAYKVTEQVSLGFGVNVTYADASIGTSTPQVIDAVTGGAIPGNATIVEMAGDDIAFGWNIGAFWQVTPTTDIALSYRSETKLNLEGAVSSDLIALYNQGGSLDLNFAAITEFAINHKLNNQWSIQSSVVFSEWSTFDKLEADLDDGTSLLLKKEDFEDTLRGALGVTYRYSDTLTLRAGYAYDDGAVSFANRSLSIPDTDRHWLTTGATYNLSENTSIDIAYAYIKGREARVNQQRVLGSIATDLTATEHAKASVFSVQLNASF